MAASATAAERPNKSINSRRFMCPKPSTGWRPDYNTLWKGDRRTIDVGTLVVQQTEPQESGTCRDINYDPLVLPQGLESSADPMLAARSAAYGTSYLRRTSEEAHLPGTVVAQARTSQKE